LSSFTESLAVVGEQLQGPVEPFLRRHGGERSAVSPRRVGVALENAN
jgi:hypothetical protein